MWFTNYEFYDKNEGLTSLPDPDYYTRQLICSEIELYPDIIKLHPTFKDYIDIPSQLLLPEEYLQLLQYSDGGGIINGEREFGYFSLQEIRYYYFAYGFPIYTPLFLPIAFNGGGIFYCYDFRGENKPILVAMSSSCAEYGDSIFLGHTLKEVLNKTVNIEDELYS